LAAVPERIFFTSILMYGSNIEVVVFSTMNLKHPMRYFLFTALVVLLSCSNFKKPSSDHSDTSNMRSNADSIAANAKADFQSQDQSYARYFDCDSSTRIKNVGYSENYLSRGHGLDYYIVKQTTETNKIRGQEGVDSKVTLDIYSIADSKLIRTITRKTDKVELSSDLIQSTKYGCCGGENRCELSEIWQDNTFLTYNDKYYVVDIPNTRIWFYLGYLSEARDENKFIHGELRFARAVGTLGAGKKFYDIEYKAISKIVFKAKTKVLYEKLTPFSPSIILLKNNDKDKLADYQDRQELNLWSYENHEKLDGITFPVMRLVFENDTTITVDIPLKNGLLFGDSSPEHTVYLDE
jgi:hypothetical protein